MSNRPEDISDKVRNIYKEIRFRPGIFLGTASLTLLNAFINGMNYRDTFMNKDNDHDHHVFIPDGFNEYVAGHYHTQVGAMNYCSHILCNESGEKNALNKFWELLDGYLTSLGYDPVPVVAINKEYSHTDGVNGVYFTDIDKLADSYMHTFNSEPWNDKWDKTTAYERLEGIYGMRGFCGYVIWKDGSPVSVIMGKEERYYDGNCFQIIEFWTEPEYQHQGYAGKLLSELKERLSDRDIKRIYLITMRGKYTEDFYKHCGFDTEDGMCVMGLDI
ncbi:MAG: GNAT family N-acetyltransferase [Oscillospiraceae bacterium]|nr:GNAT family N-acetyltransferase [Oscillospiraceae bacterium]